YGIAHSASPPVAPAPPACKVAHSVSPPAPHNTSSKQSVPSTASGIQSSTQRITFSTSSKIELTLHGLQHTEQHTAHTLQHLERKSTTSSLQHASHTFHGRVAQSTSPHLQHITAHAARPSRPPAHGAQLPALTARSR